MLSLCVFILLVKLCRGGPHTWLPSRYFQDEKKNYEKFREFITLTKPSYLFDPCSAGRFCRWTDPKASFSYCMSLYEWEIIDTCRNLLFYALRTNIHLLNRHWHVPSLHCLLAGHKTSGARRFLIYTNSLKCWSVKPEKLLISF